MAPLGDDFRPPVYPQLWGDFIYNLSALDLLLNCGPKSREIVLGEGSTIKRNVILGDDVVVHPNVKIERDVTIGDRVEIGIGCTPPLPFCTVIKKETMIGNDVRIGMEVVVRDSVTVLDDTEIQDGADVPDGTTVGGTVGP